MKAENITIKEWLESIENGSLRLPRFQREGDVWKNETIGKFLLAILQDQPLGVFLTLSVDPKDQPFDSRHFLGAPNNAKNKCNKHLLDGQQRLTALWNSLKPKNGSHTWYVKFQGDYKKGYEIADVKAQKNSSKSNTPDVELAESLIPFYILDPNDTGYKKHKEWLKKATMGRKKETNSLDSFITTLTEEMAVVMIPHIDLKQGTKKKEAIQIFIETNRSSSKLKAYDLAVAEAEKATSKSLPDKIKDLETKVPKIKKLGDSVKELVLKTQCLIQTSNDPMKPSQGNYKKIKFDNLFDNWDRIVEGLKWAAEIYNEEGIWGKNKVPSVVPLRILPAIHKYYDETESIKEANSGKLIKKYLWNAFLTDHYKSRPNNQLLDDYTQLKNMLKGNNNEILKELGASRGTSNIASLRARVSIETKNQLKSAKWPTKIGTSKAILLACCLDGAKDINTQKELLAEDREVDFHHIFPKKLFKNSGAASADLVLNCMLLLPETNRKDWRDKWPGDFLKAASTQLGSNWKDEVKKLLNGHLLPTDILFQATESSNQKLKAVYDDFLNQRADLVFTRISTLLQDGKI